MGTTTEDPDNPTKWIGGGTRLYLAPEQRKQKNLPPFLFDDDNRSLSSYTNLWAVGATMYELLTLHHVWPALYEDVIDPEGTKEGLPTITTGKDLEYSWALRSLIQKCLRPRPEDRPRIGDVQHLIEKMRRQFAENFQQRRENQQVPLEEERLYYRDKEIEGMARGNFVPSRTESNPQESGFQDPDFTPIRFPGDTVPTPTKDVEMGEGEEEYEDEGRGGGETEDEYEYEDEGEGEGEGEDEGEGEYEDGGEDEDEGEDEGEGEDEDEDESEDESEYDDDDDSGSGDGDEAERRVLSQHAKNLLAAAGEGGSNKPNQGDVKYRNKFGRPAMRY